MFCSLRSTTPRTVRFLFSKCSRTCHTRADKARDLEKCVQKTKVQVCGDLWKDFKARGWKRYQDAPSEGIVTEVEYFDNRDIVGTSNRTVLLLHGSPGSFGHFWQLISDLTPLGVRVISPNLPPIELTRQCPHFRQSPEERLEVLKAVLTQANVTSVDLVGCHSTGALVGLRMFSDVHAPTPRSVVLFNPVGHEVVPVAKPEWLLNKFIATHWQTISGRSIVEEFAPLIMEALGNAFAKNKVDDIVLTAMCYSYNSLEQFKSLYEDIVKAKVPMAMFMSDNDAVMDKVLNANLVKTCGLSPDDVTKYNAKGQLEREGAINDSIKVIRTAAGGHFSYLKYPDIVTPIVLELLDKVTKNSVTTET